MTPRWITAFFDLPEATYEAGADFWSAVTGYPRSPQRGEHDQFATLVPSGGQDYLRLQRVGDGGPRVHLDLSVDDLATAGPCPRPHRPDLLRHPSPARGPAGMT
jgi:hypothetical protein